MRDVDHQNPVAGQDFPAAEPLPAEPLPAEPLPVDEAGLETGDDRNIATPLQDTVPAAPAGQDAPLFAADVAARLRARWRELQADFVDDPQRAVREADEVVDEVMRTIAAHRERLAGEWQGHTDTEHLRLALREYRSFFDRLLPT